MMRIALIAVEWVRAFHRDERGLNTAELLGNAALAIVALVAIWFALKQAGLDIVAMITDRIMNEDLDA
jgi:hypothetical protein